jgi:hypothetical protein
VRRHAGTFLLVAIAVVGAIAPMPPAYVERVYSRPIYPAVQWWLTMASNTIPIALLDIAIGVVLIALAWLLVVRTRRTGFRRASGLTLVTLIRFAAVVYLAFLVLWGLNYRRVPLEQRLDYDRARVTRESVLAFANRAVSEINVGYAGAHALTADLGGLEYAFYNAESALGARAPTMLGVPKQSLLTLYFRAAGIDGMTDPIFLEIIVNPDVLEIERPMVVAHEWGHLAGYANESEASFVAWLTCISGDPLAQYSGWFAAYEHALRALPRQDRATVQPLDPGPREDLRAMAARYARTSPVVRKAAASVYDEYLRANRVPEGIGSYDAVLRLMVGTRFDAHWRPVVR